MPIPFHLAIAVDDLVSARQFYGELLGCAEGRSTDCWVDFNFFEHQLVCHQVDQRSAVAGLNPVDGEQIPVPHFGVVVSRADWDSLVAKLNAVNTAYRVQPQVRFAGEAGEQATFFVDDPSGNVLEFKAFADPEQLFAR